MRPPYRGRPAAHLRTLSRLILIKDAASRSDLQAGVAKGARTTRRLAVAVAGLRGEKTSPDGRTVAVPEDLDTKRLKPIELTGRWLRFYDALAVTEAELAWLYFEVTRRRDKEHDLGDRLREAVATLRRLVEPADRTGREGRRAG